MVSRLLRWLNPRGGTLAAMLVRLHGPFADFEVHAAHRMVGELARDAGERLRCFDEAEVLALLGPALRETSDYVLRGLLAEHEESSFGQTSSPAERLARFVVCGAIVIVRAPRVIRASEVVERYEAEYLPPELLEREYDVVLWTAAESEDLDLDVESEHDELELEATADVEQLDLGTKAAALDIDLETRQ